MPTVNITWQEWRDRLRHSYVNNKFEYLGWQRVDGEIVQNLFWPIQWIYNTNFDFKYTESDIRYASQMYETLLDLVSPVDGIAHHSLKGILND